MRLTDLNPQFPGVYGQPNRHGVAVIFDCPCGCGNPCYVPFRNPIDGGDPLPDDQGRPLWKRTGETFEALTLSPSIHRSRGCGWHGFVTDGAVTSC